MKILLFKNFIQVKSSIVTNLKMKKLNQIPVKANLYCWNEYVQKSKMYLLTFVAQFFFSKCYF